MPINLAELRAYEKRMRLSHGHSWRARYYGDEQIQLDLFEPETKRRYRFPLIGYCELCGSSGEAIASECPRAIISADYRRRIAAGVIDYINEKWTELYNA